MALPPRPAYRDLEDRSAWGMYGGDDPLGALNLLTDEAVVAAASLVKTGKRFSLDLPIDQPSPPLFGRQAIEHAVYRVTDSVMDDRLDSFYPQGSTQWDAFGHFNLTDGRFYNGYSTDDVVAGALGMDHWARRGIVGRGVLLDVAGYCEANGTPIDAATAFCCDAQLLGATAEAQGVELRTGDILCVRLGWVGWYQALAEADKVELSRLSKLAFGGDGVDAGPTPGTTLTEFALPGFGPPRAVTEFLWDHGAVAFATDTPGVEAPGSVDPEDEGAEVGAFDPDRSIHSLAMVRCGIPMGEFFMFEELAADCRADGRYEFFFVSSPLTIPAGIGSPPNVIAIK